MKQVIEIYKDMIIALQQIRIMQLQSEIRNREIISKLERMC